MNTKKDEQEEIYRSYRLTFRIIRNLSPDTEPDDYICNICGEIICTEETDTESREVRAGTINGYLINVNRIMEDGISLFDACDGHSQTVHDYGCVLFDFRRGELKRTLDEQFGGIGASNALILDKIEVLPGHRGRGVGLAAACSFLDTFEGGCGLAVCEPYPMQFKEITPDHSEWCKKMGVESFVTDRNRALAKLRTHWRRLGFQPIRGTKKFALSLERRRPTLKELVPDL